MSDIDYEPGAVLEALNNKADIDLGNVEASVESAFVKSDLSNLQADVVIESQLPTAENNYTWYRLYKSGWVEQGSSERKSASGNSSGVQISYTLPIEMENNGYTGLANASFGGGSAWNGPVKDVNTSTTNTVVFGSWVTGSATVEVRSWVVYGMSAQGAS